MGVNQVDSMLKPFEPSVCCDLCGWSQEYPVRAKNIYRVQIGPSSPQYMKGLCVMSPDGLCTIPEDCYSKTSIYLHQHPGDISARCNESSLKPFECGLRYADIYNETIRICILSFANVWVRRIGYTAHICLCLFKYNLSHQDISRLTAFNSTVKYQHNKNYNVCIYQLLNDCTICT